jgi:hypothetical protein
LFLFVLLKKGFEKNKEKTIYFEYIAKNFVRKINNFSHRDTEENNMKYVIDNYGSENNIESTLKINFEDKIDIINMNTYPYRKNVKN